MVDRIRKSTTPASLLMFGLLALLLAVVQAYVNGQFTHNLGNVAAVKLLFADNTDSTYAASASDYFLGLMAYAQKNYAVADQRLHTAMVTHRPYARHWIALAMEKEGRSEAGRMTLDLYDRSEVLLYGDMLMREWDIASADEKDQYRNFLKAQEPSLLLPFADRLLSAGDYKDAGTWASAIPDYQTSIDALTILGKAALGEDAPAIAEKWFGSAYGLKQNTATAYLYGLALALGSQPERAIKILETGVADTAGEDPTLPWMLRMLAIAHARSGHCAEAVKVFDEAAASNFGDENQQRVAASRDQYMKLCKGQE